MVDRYVDDFGNYTNKKYVKNTFLIEGTFSNTATQNSELNARLLIDSYNDMSIMLFEYGGNNPVKSYGDESYYINVQDNNGKKYQLRGTNWSFDRISLSRKSAPTLHNILKRGGKIMFYIYEYDNTVNNYQFTIDNATYYDNAYRIMTTGK